MDLSLTLCLPRDAVSVPLSRRVTSQLLRSVGFHSEDVEDIELALTEACSNVLRHSESGTEYEVRLQVEADLVVIAVQDMGTGPSALQKQADATAEGEEGGRGIPLMRALVDDLSFHLVEGQGSIVRMERRMRAEPGSHAAAVLLPGIAAPAS